MTMDADEHREQVARSMAEATFQKQIEYGCDQLGRLHYHTRQVAQCPQCHGPAACRRGCLQADGKPQRAVAMGSNPGFPDLVIPVPPTLWLAELKTVYGRLSPAQDRWREQLIQCREVRYRVWSPADRDEIHRALLGSRLPDKEI